MGVLKGWRGVLIRVRRGMGVLIGVTYFLWWCCKYCVRLKRKYCVVKMVE